LTLRQFVARMDRHVERLKECERMERFRIGTATAMVMNTGMATKQDKTPWVPWDVFPELQPDEEVEDHSNAMGILGLFKAMAAGQQMAGDN
jgi:hypothetical protein